MDNSLIIGIISLIGAIHFSFAKNLIERIHEKSSGVCAYQQKEKENQIAKIYYFIPLSDGMVGFMFLSLLIYISVLIMEDLRFASNKFFMQFTLVAFGLLFGILYGWIWRDVVRAISFIYEKYGRKHSPGLIYFGLLMFILLFSIFSLYLVSSVYQFKFWSCPVQSCEFLKKFLYFYRLLVFLAGWCVYLAVVRY